MIRKFIYSAMNPVHGMRPGLFTKFIHLNLKHLTFFLVFLFMTSLSGLLNAQTDSTKTAVNKKDTTSIVIGKKEIKIIDTEKGTDIKVQRKEEDENMPNRDITAQDDEAGKSGKHSGLHSGGFRGHWQGIEFGLANYVNSSRQFELSQASSFLNLNTSRSYDFNLNAFQHCFGLIGNQVGLVTGIGLGFTNYFFDNNNSIKKTNPDGYIVSDDSYTLRNVNLEKSKLAMTYLNIPLLLEFQFPGALRTSKRIRFSGGIIGGLKLRSHTKVVYRENGHRQKDKNNDDFNLSSLRYGFTARVGYGHINIFATYYPVTLFESGKAPEPLYPVSVGLALVHD